MTQRWCTGVCLFTASCPCRNTESKLRAGARYFLELSGTRVETVALGSSRARFRSIFSLYVPITLVHTYVCACIPGLSGMHGGAERTRARVCVCGDVRTYIGAASSILRHRFYGYIYGDEASYGLAKRFPRERSRRK